ncbi:replication protein [Aerococcaceae bacterium zg-B36]|uniref:DnaB-like helicase C-terminal domain-containing protein n=1 Tax=Aerococcaceae bacterium zg-252 TaxID=2796928 RepID=UPI001BD8C511|nr:replication protein [Aerococcaceae bacterium zg-B36]
MSEIEYKNEPLAELSKRTLMIMIGALYANTDLFYEYKLPDSIMKISLEAGMFYSILRRMLSNGIEKISKLEVDTFISQQNQKLQAMYSQYGFDIIEDIMATIQRENMDNYYSNVLKIVALNKMSGYGFKVEEQQDKLFNMTYEQLSNYFETMTMDAFSDFDSSNEKVEDLKQDLDELINLIEADKYVGLPVESLYLNRLINGQTLGDITMLAGMSGVGKTFLTVTLTLPNIIRNNIPVLIICNEEDKNKWKWSILVWVINNIIAKQPEFHKQYIDKNRMFQNMKFQPEERKVIEAAKKWYEENLQDGIINFVNLESFSMDRTIRLIRKYAASDNIQYFILDTFKLDNTIGTKVTDIAWLELQQNMVKLYNVIKESNKNVHVWITYQLSKQTRRYLDQSALGMSKNVADVVSTLILARPVFESEKSSDKGKLKVKDENGRSLDLDPAEDYMVLFVDKNRSGSKGQVVLRTDKGKNMIADVGNTSIHEDI